MSYGSWEKNLKKEPPPIEENTRKARRNRKPINCKIKRRGGSPYIIENCGICGSENITMTKLVYCIFCDKEEYTKWEPWEFKERMEDRRKYLFEEQKDICSCEFKPHMKYGRVVNYYCLDCNAIYSSLCPNCNKKAWSKMTRKGKRLVTCLSCGFFINE